MERVGGGRHTCQVMMMMSLLAVSAKETKVNRNNRWVDGRSVTFVALNKHVTTHLGKELNK